MEYGSHIGLCRWVGTRAEGAPVEVVGAAVRCPSISNDFGIVDVTEQVHVTAEGDVDHVAFLDEEGEILCWRPLPTGMAHAGEQVILIPPGQVDPLAVMGP